MQIREIGSPIVDPDVASHTVVAGPTAATPRRTDDLTAREREVLSLLAQGLTDRGLSENLWLTPKTVEMHVRHILAKLDLGDGWAHRANSSSRRRAGACSGIRPRSSPSAPDERVGKSRQAFVTPPGWLMARRKSRG